jgi:hypothetical protein
MIVTLIFTYMYIYMYPLQELISRPSHVFQLSLCTYPGHPMFRVQRWTTWDGLDTRLLTTTLKPHHSCPPLHVLWVFHSACILGSKPGITWNTANDLISMYLCTWPYLVVEEVNTYSSNTGSIHSLTMQYLPLLAKSMLLMALPDSLKDLSILQDLAPMIST